MAQESPITGSESTFPVRRLFGIPIAAVTLQNAVEIIENWISDRSPKCRYVVTPNVDHVVMLRRDAAMQAAYAGASMIVADGWPIVSAARLLGQAIPERVAGSDLGPMLFQSANRRNKELRVFLLGGKPGIPERAAAKIQSQYSDVKVVGGSSPPLGFQYDDTWNRRLVDEVNRSASHILVIGLGAPKQELWISAHREQLHVPVALCAGATIDFLAGHQRRAPVWMQRSKMEWMHRLATNPRRLFLRYVRGAVLFPGMVWNERQRLRQN